MLKFYATASILWFTAVFCSVSFAAAPGVEPAAMWSGKITDKSLRKLAPQSGFIADAETWKKLWAAWRPGEEVPVIDFSRKLILVGVVPGPNRVTMRPAIDQQGDIHFTAAGTEVGGPGFGYKLVGFHRHGAKTVNGKTIVDDQPANEESITVEVVGTLRTGIAAIGGETTGTTITAKGITWELDLSKNAAFRKAAKKMHGKTVGVQGNLERRSGVEIGERWIVTVTGLKATGQRNDENVKFSGTMVLVGFDPYSSRRADSKQRQEAFHQALKKVEVQIVTQYNNGNYLLLDCGTNEPAEVLTKVPHHAGAIVFRDGKLASAIASSDRKKIPKSHAVLRWGSTANDMKRMQADIKKYSNMPGVVAEQIDPAAGRFVLGNSQLLKLTPGAGKTLLDMFIMTEAEFDFADNTKGRSF
jgi:hypothetical protein